MIFRYQSGTRLASGGDENGTTGDWQYETVKSSKNVTLTYAAANLLATQSGAITGTGGLTYNSPGTLALTAANTFSGNTRVQAGTLNLAHANSLQSSTLDMNAADGGSVGFAVAGTATYALGGLQGSRSLDLGSNSLTLGGNGASTTYSGNLSVGGTLTKTGVGTLTLSGSNTLSSGLSLDAGTLTLGSAGRTAIPAGRRWRLVGSSALRRACKARSRTTRSSASTRRLPARFSARSPAAGPWRRTGPARSCWRPRTATPAAPP